MHMDMTTDQSAQIKLGQLIWRLRIASRRIAQLRVLEDAYSAAEYDVFLDAAEELGKDMACLEICAEQLLRDYGEAPSPLGLEIVATLTMIAAELGSLSMLGHINPTRPEVSEIVEEYLGQIDVLEREFHSRFPGAARLAVSR